MTDRSRIPVCILAKVPRAGHAKTRLAPALGVQGAAALARAMLEDTIALVCRLPWARVVVASDGHLPIRLPAGVELWDQGSGDLGHRIERVLRRALQGAPSAIVVGADAPGVPSRAFEQARRRLATGSAVVGPTEDGGFYLLGVPTCPAGLLAGIPWSTARTLAATVARLAELGLRVEPVEGWFDVDRPEDLARLARLAAAGVSEAPQSLRVLRGGTPSAGRCWP